MRRSTALERRIQKDLGLSHAQIATLIRIGGKKKRVTGGTAGAALERKGLVTEWRYEPGLNPFTDPGVMHPRELTEAGRDALARARTLGY